MAGSRKSSLKKAPSSGIKHRVSFSDTPVETNITSLIRDDYEPAPSDTQDEAARWIFEDFLREEIPDYPPAPPEEPHAEEIHALFRQMAPQTETAAEAIDLDNPDLPTDSEVDSLIDEFIRLGNRPQLSTNEREEIEANSRTSLLNHPPQLSLTNKIYHAFLNFGKTNANNAYQGAVWVKKHPILFLVALFTAAPNAIFAFTPHPEKLKEALKAMGKSELALSSTKFFSSLMINGIMNAYFLLTAWDKIKIVMQRFKHPISDPVDFIEGLGIVALAIAAAVGAGALSYSAFSWLPLSTLFGLIPAVVSLGVNFASRFVGINTVFVTADSMFNKDARIQTELADVLQHLNLDDANVKAEFEGVFAHLKQAKFANKLNEDPNAKASQQDIESMAIDLARHIADLKEAQENLIRDKTNQELIKKYCLTGIKVFYLGTILIMGAVPYGATYLQKGRDGINILMGLIGKLFGVNWGLDKAPRAVQLAWGSGSGLATLMLALAALGELPSTTAEVYQGLKQNPQNIVNATVLAGGNVLGAFGPYSVPDGIINNPDNILGLSPGVFAQVFKVLNGAAGGLINFRYSMKKAFAPEPETISLKDLTLAHIINRMNDPLDHRITHDTAIALSNTHGLFATKVPDNRRRPADAVGLNSRLSAP